MRSIPAHAGEPPIAASRSTPPRVYPRACGGTAGAPLSVVSGKGLSPRMRGNQRKQTDNILAAGSIPAHAGEPLLKEMRLSPLGVYPRACGGTHGGIFRCESELGLSPRMRGNPQIGVLAGTAAGSIPAHAGEPFSGGFRSGNRKVYPRACGGTMDRQEPGRRGSGLTPRMRGNLSGCDSRLCGRGSIPAHAGEPCLGYLASSAVRVYPRACGGTKDFQRYASDPQGLSPRMRGNPGSGGGADADRGSIPAHAGEPCDVWPAIFL